MSLINPFLLLAHVLGAMGLVAGMLARQLTRAEARKAADLKVFLALEGLAGRFEDRLVRPGSTAILVSGLALALLQGWPLLGFLQGAQANWLLVANILVITIILLIVFVFVPRGKVYEPVRQAAIAKGEITPELRRSFADPVVRAAHIYEGLATVAIIVLMIVKPF
jgi:hypothetical protein